MPYRYGDQFYAGAGVSTMFAMGDFETFSAAGYVWGGAANKWGAPRGSKDKGLFAVGAATYAMHPTTEVLSFAYDLLDGKGRQIWLPGMPNPMDLFQHLAQRRYFEAWNVAFEWWIWNYVCRRRYGWPPLPEDLIMCAMAKSRAHSMPGALGNAASVMRVAAQKDTEGKRLLDKFSVPRNPTKKDVRIRVLPAQEPEEFERLVAYNVQDIAAEEDVAVRLPDLPPDELEFWRAHERINRRGVHVDQATVADAITLIEQAFEKYNAELAAITGGAVTAASQLQKLKEWLHGQNVHMDEMDEDAIDTALGKMDPAAPAYRALQIRQRVGSAAVKKLYAFERLVAPTGRIHDAFVFHSAHTGRSASMGLQLQNFVNSGPDVQLCECGKHYGKVAWHDTCPHCGTQREFSKTVEWDRAAVDDCIETMRNRSLDYFEYVWGDAFPAISGSLRGMLCAAPGHELIVSDYSAIEAVVLAALAGEEWRLEVFRTHGKIYEMSASKITGVPLEEYLEYKKRTGQHHPDRKKIGKVAELASGYGGSVGAWKAFGADEFFTDEEIKEKVYAWRDASPMIVNLWNGLERCALGAVRSPGSAHAYRQLSFQMIGNVLYMTLPSGRRLSYHNPLIEQNQWGKDAISFEGWNTNPKMGPTGWIRKQTFGGRLAENATQAVSNDLLRGAIVRLEPARYPIVMHVHDELIAEVPTGFGSIEEMERLMAVLPPWAAGWPVKAAGGWRAIRYGK